jgi:predicted PhzF superfamily epimerase YddE/YHI9
MNGLGVKSYVMSGNSFIDVRDPGGLLGNPFTVIMGREVGTWTTARRQALARRSGTPETIFVNALRQIPSGGGTTGSEVSLTVQTPTGQELGACAHGFIGAVRALLDAGMLSPAQQLNITTTIRTSVRVSLIAEPLIALHFVCAESRDTRGHRHTLERIFGVPMPRTTDRLRVLSVGSPKLTVEVSPDAFAGLCARLDDLDYHRLMTLQRALGINGVHVFCRDPATCLPERCVQVNAYLGPELVVDRATGVAIAAQVGADPQVGPGQELQVTQYTRSGPAARLSVTKGHGRDVQVGGAAVVLDRRELGRQW